ncbi:hypothetical protein CHS0354_040185 [Potamilus streckersoni]|uniref:Uncharacterized protein n=1 Tax=Potamilus streckersoni TaxID=2493646 RepID=A0AAE0VVW8_9BIVA|nr:hypothetical protein CHS0354_040185 [Potamilus streckersoni]
MEEEEMYSHLWKDMTYATLMNYSHMPNSSQLQSLTNPKDLLSAQFVTVAIVDGSKGLVICPIRHSCNCLRIQRTCHLPNSSQLQSLTDPKDLSSAQFVTVAIVDRSKGLVICPIRHSCNR